MYLKRLRITNKDGLIRDINFHMGLNLIVDDTIVENRTDTGNSVGKTTVLRLIDFCLGKDAKVIYTDPVDSKSVHKEVKDFLENTGVEIELILTRNWHADDIVIRRDFAKGRRALRMINGEKYIKENFEDALSEHLFGFRASKPTFRQIISHNIRYTDVSINNVLKTLDKYTSDAEYEALYLFMFGCVYNETDMRQELMAKITTETAFKKRLEKVRNKSAYATLLGLVNSKIDELNKKKESLNINPNFERDLESLDDLKFEINSVSSEISNLKLKRGIILDTKKEIENEHSDIDVRQLSDIYEQAKVLIPNLQKTFEDLLSYHNKMVDSRARFVSMSLPRVNERIQLLEEKNRILLDKEKELTDIVLKSATYQNLEDLISEMNQEYQKKGEYESQIKQIETVEEAIAEAEKSIEKIDKDLFSEEFRERVQSNINKFNVLFSKLSKKLYGEEYVVKVDIVNNYHNTGREIYKFSAFNANLSSGKKMGEISCFDIAYTMFARDNEIRCLPFLLNDKRELMSDNQLVGIAEIVKKENIQFVASILKDKLPVELQDKKYYITELSDKDKLFKI